MTIHAAHPVATTVEGVAVVDDTKTIETDLCLIPVLLIDRTIPLDTPVHPQRLPAQLVAPFWVKPVTQLWIA